MKMKIDISHLQVGMYVSELDRPWLDSPFLFQGFTVRNDDDFTSVNKLCEYVVIDTDKGDEFKPEKKPLQKNILKVVKNKYKNRIPITTSFSDELKRTKIIHSSARIQLDKVFHDARMGKNVDVHPVKKVVTGLVDSIVRNPDAELWLTHLRKRDEYTAIHSLNVCIFSITFARFLGFSKVTMNEIGIGALLHDIGKMRVPLEILNKEGKLTEAERTIIQKHAEYGYDMLKKSQLLPDVVLDIVYTHHERKNGKGYPRGLSGSQIHLFSRMVAIVDVYDAITSDRVYHHGMNTLDALRNMFKWRETDLDSELVEDFIQCLGIYPIGSIVELSTAEVGIVISMSQGKRLVPVVMIVRDAEQNKITPPHIMDLSLFTKENNENPVDIRKVLDTRSSNIDLIEYIKQEIII